MPQTQEGGRGRKRSGQTAPEPRVRDHARAFVGSAVGAVANRISGPRAQTSAYETQPPQQGRRRNGRGRQQGKGRRFWIISESDRPVLAFGQGDLAQVFSCIPQLRIDSPGAAVAMVRFLASHQQVHADQPRERDLEHARNELTRLLCQIWPNPASIASAKAGQREAQASSSVQGKLTASLTYLEQQYLLFVHGQSPQVGIRQLATQLVNIADTLKGADSHRRQASARIMAADVYLQLSESSQANHQMVQGFALMGMLYPNQELVKLAESVDSGLVEQTISTRSTVASTSRQPVGATAGPAPSTSQSDSSI